MPFREPNFDRVARIYRWAEYLALGPLLQRTRTRLIPQLPMCSKAFVLGDGDGRALVALLRQQPGLEALAVDSSAAMLQLLKQRNPTAHIMQASALVQVPPAGTDLITTHFFLDCLTQPEVDALAARLAAHTASGTLWLLSDFAVPAHGLLRPVANAYIRALYLAFRVLTGLRVTRLPDIHSALILAGFERLQRQELLFGLLYTELWQRK